MADTSNLTNFLNDVADAIRTKKETTEQIPAANFDSEILSIETGIDTSDATATASDIISPKTAYVNGKKITGNIIPEYKIDDVSEYKTKIIKSLSGVDVFHAYEYNNYVSIITMSGTTINFIIYDNTQNTIIGSTTFSSLDTFDAGISGNLNPIVGDVMNYVYSDTENETKYIIGVTGQSKSEYYRQAFLMLKYNKLDNTFSFSTTTAKRALFGHNGTQPNTQKFALDPKVPNVIYLYESSWSGGSFGKITLNISELDVVTPTLSTNIIGYISAVGSFSFTGNGDYISTGSHLIKRNANTGDITKYTQGYTYLSYNLNYMWVANKLYKITPNDDFNIMFNSKELIFDCGLTGNYVAYFSQDEKYIIVDTTSANLGIATYKITGDTVALSKSFNYNSYLLESGLNSLNFYTWNGTDTSLMKMYAEVGESRLSKLNRDDLCFINIEEYNVPDNSKVLSGATYYRSDGTITLGSMPNLGRLEITPREFTQELSEGYISGGVVNVAKIANSDEYGNCLDYANCILNHTTKLPYKQLSYIQTDGNQWIATGLNASSDLDVEIKFKTLRTGTGYGRVIGTTRDCNYEFCDMKNISSYRFSINRGRIQNNISVDNSNFNTVKIIGTGKLYINNKLIVDLASSPASVPVQLFTSMSGEEGGVLQVVYCKMWKANELVRYYISASDKDSTICLYDRVTKEYYYNQGTGVFIGGAEV